MHMSVCHCLQFSSSPLVLTGIWSGEVHRFCEFDKRNIIVEVEVVGVLLLVRRPKVLVNVKFSNGKILLRSIILQPLQISNTDLKIS